MKRFVLIGIVLLLITGAVAGVPKTVFAFSGGPGNLGGDQNITPIDSTSGTYTGVDNSGSGSSNNIVTGNSGDSSTGSSVQTGNNTTPSATTPTPPSNNGGSQSVDPTSAFGYLFGGLLTIFAWLAGAAGVVLNDAVYYTVFQMGNILNANGQGLTAIGVAWRVLRDIGNIVLIFGFLAVGISTIIGVNSYGVEKRLPMLLIVAVMLNFSLFISEAIIDGGNIFASEFYTQINSGQSPTVQGVSYVNSSGSISNAIMNTLGLQTIFNVGGANGKGLSQCPGGVILNCNILPSGNSQISSGTIMLIGFLGVILFIVTAFVLFSLAFVLIARFVILLFLIIVAPIGFVGLIIPGLEKTASEWWNQLVKQTITAPALLLMLYVALAVITDANFLSGFGATGSQGWANTATAGSAGAIQGLGGLILSFLIAMGLLLACVMLAKKMSAFGAGFAVKAGGWASFGAIAGHMTAMVGGSAWLSRKTLQRYAPNSRVAQTASKYLLRPLENARWDMRSLPGVKAGLEAVGAKEAAAPITKSAVQEIRGVADSFKKRSEEEDRSWQQQTVVPRLRAALATGDPDEIDRVMRNLSDKQLENRSVRSLIAQSPAAAAMLPQARFDRLMQSDELTNAEKNEFRAARRDGTRARFSATPHATGPYAGRSAADVTLNGAPAGPGGVPPARRAMSSSARAQLDSDILVQPHVMALLTASDFAAIAHRAELSPTDQATMAAYVRGIAAANPQIAALLAGNPQFAAYFP